MANIFNLIFKRPLFYLFLPSFFYLFSVIHSNSSLSFSMVSLCFPFTYVYNTLYCLVCQRGWQKLYNIIQEIKSISIVASAELSVTTAYLLIPVISGYLITWLNLYIQISFLFFLLFFWKKKRKISKYFHICESILKHWNCSFQGMGLWKCLCM